MREPRSARCTRSRFALAAGVAVLAVAAVFAGVARPAAAEPAAPIDPFGAVHLLDHEQVGPDVTVATSKLAMSVVAWRARRADGSYQASAAVQLAGHAWGRPVALSPPGQNAAHPQAIAWGADRVSVLWEVAGRSDSWTFLMRTVTSGGWGPVITLRRADYSFPGFSADLNAAGELVLAWENGDHRVRVALRHSDGTWDTPAAVPVVSPGTTFRYVANPQAVFLSASGDVSVVPWGTRTGTNGTAVWLADRTAQNGWRTTRVGPTLGSQLSYSGVPSTRFAANPGGAFAAVWPQQDPRSKQWTTMFAYRPAGGELGSAQPLGHYRCDLIYDQFPGACGDVAVSDAGPAIVTWAEPANEVDIVVARTSATGHVGAAQRVFSVDWDNTFAGVAIDSNGKGDATVVFTGGNHQVIYQQFVRCPANQACAAALSRQNGPSWLDSPRPAILPNGATQFVWTAGCAGGEACRPDKVYARQLASA